MKVTYKLKPASSFPKDPTGQDKKKREKVEEALGKKLTDTEWFNYKLLTMQKGKI